MTRINQEKTRENWQIKQEMAEKLSGYSAVAGAALLVAAPTAEALPITLTGPLSTQPIDLDGDGTDDITIIFGTDGSGGGGAIAYGDSGVDIAKYGTNSVARFANSSDITGSAVSMYANFAYLGVTGVGFAFLGERGFLGVRFDSPLNGVGNDSAFVDLEMAADDQSLIIHNFGLVGASTPVPEPTTLSTLAIGLGGLYAMRRRRKQQAEVLDNKN